MRAGSSAAPSHTSGSTRRSAEGAPPTRSSAAFQYPGSEVYWSHATTAQRARSTPRAGSRISGTARPTVERSGMAGAKVTCIAGGGPAGMMLGYLLARAGVEVVVLEKHADFLRDFRGDTVHPSTLEILHELGLLEEFLRLPHQEVREIG